MLELLSRYMLISKAIENTINLNVLAFSEYEDSEVYGDAVNKFNNYSKEHQLDVSLNLNLLTNLNSTGDNEDIGSTIEYLLRKKKNKYDLYFFDDKYTFNYGNYLYNISEFLPQSNIDLFDNNILKQTCTYENTLVAIPFTFSYNVLYSNRDLLKKYNKTVPETWEELVEIAKYILNEEKEKPELIGYNGLFDKSDNGLYSLYEFIYSCRESVDSPFPSFIDSTAENSLNLLKRIKNEISSG
ncbi:hypothetical protein BCR32DRAFT_242849 [Anaeromyces robustus]|uniref:Periplasmic binding protein-like II n=1 Tax=Anaeromyces robustus TaxID=1754192 RepID=A0A1Y1XEL1_9FUNG|nr:hypothetical protein BCR32DRAFT_242849 [Anaeromyces robustus]|eukprot:ORX84147.1 hypothetical protein BCR32DRAFT_242849 [Anaeromyces robustus]